MRPFRQAGRDFYDLKVPFLVGSKVDWKKRPTGTSDGVTADDIADMVEYLHEKAQAWDVLDRITAQTPTLTVSQLWAYWQGAPKIARNGRTLEPGDGERLEHARARLSEVNLDDLVDDWSKAGAKPRYVAQVRRLVVKGERFPLEKFRRSVISKHLASLPGGLNTRVHHRVAFSRFGQYLTQCELIETNPARDVEFEEKLSRDLPLFLEGDQPKAVILAMPDGEAKAVNALAYATGMEWSCFDNAAALRDLSPKDLKRRPRVQLRARDFDLDKRMVFANGGKTKWRTRWVEITEDWAFDIVYAYVHKMTPNTLFTTMSWKMHDLRLEQACKAASMPEVTLHKWRHTFAAMWIDRGALTAVRDDKRDEKWLKNQFGHSPASQLIRNTYGVRIHKAELSAQQEARLTLARTHDNRISAMK